MLPDFELFNTGKYRDALEKRNIRTFSELCAYVQHIPYGRTSKRSDLSLVFTENKGTCSAKHGLLMELCELNHENTLELMVGIFLMNENYSPKIAPVLARYGLEHIPEAHCYLRYEGKRYDLTSPKADPAAFESFLVREQRCDSQQVTDWKPMIHKHYIGGWLQRKKLPFTPEEIWAIREECILSLSNS
ncbi:MAG: hypothetical protein ACO1O6_02950 [Bacteroidota bacterium]